jgi:hypothetical protein
MEGLFYYHDSDSLTFLRFYADGRVVSYGKSIRFDQGLPSFPWLRVDSDRVNFGWGNYYVDAEVRIRIRAEGTLGNIDYIGTIHSKDRIDIRCRCPITNHRKMETFRRFSVKENVIFCRPYKGLIG